MAGVAGDPYCHLRTHVVGLHGTNAQLEGVEAGTGRKVTVQINWRLEDEEFEQIKDRQQRRTVEPGREQFMTTPQIGMIWAQSGTGVIGRGNAMPFAPA